jgi:hypothetical protein
MESVAEPGAMRRIWKRLAPANEVVSNTSAGDSRSYMDGQPTAATFAIRAPPLIPDALSLNMEEGAMAGKACRLGVSPVHCTASRRCLLSTGGASYSNHGAIMYYKKPAGDYFELVAVTRVHVLEQNRAGDFEVLVELADGTTHDRIYTRTEYAELLVNPPRVIV